MTFHLLQRTALVFGAVALAGCVACGDDSTAVTPTPRPSTTAVSGSSTAGSNPGAATTATAASATTATPKPVTAVPTASNQVPAVQVVIDYYRAINAKDYATAYHLWASNGGASNQTAQQFADGFANTVRVDANLDQPSAESSGLKVPVTVRSIVNNPGQDQSIQLFEGAYHLQLAGSDWRITSADISTKPVPTEAASEVKDPLSTLNSYFAALDSGAYARAYTYWSDEGSASGQSFADFIHGFDNTTSTNAQFGEPQLQGAAGSGYATVPTVIISTQKDGSRQAFCGDYSLRRVDLRPFDLLGWSIDKANVKAITGGVPSAAAQQQMLANSCTG
jgi:hypothetical protein